MKAPINVLIVGATSAIAEASARLWAAEGAHLYLVARNQEKLQLAAKDLTVRGAHVQCAEFDALDVDRHAEILERVFREMGRLDVALIAHGILPNQAAVQDSAALTLESLQINAISVVSMVTIIANKLQAQGSGIIAVIGSVAGDRGRKSNYVYGSAKALLSTFLEGIAGRLHPHGVSVINIKPGFVDTPMTSQFKKGILWAAPGSVARVIHTRVASAKSGSFYAPGFWWLIMLIVRHVPARILYRLNI
jgi:decaprenylphospho-beta-D-erythro-pentofuranosid-2-ulose 2-reductase